MGYEYALSNVGINGKGNGLTMAGNREGGLKAYKTNIQKRGKNFYREIGAIGGRNGHTGGFAANPELAKRAGAKGGARGKRKGMTDRTKTKIAMAKAMEAEGYTRGTIAKVMGKHINTIYKYLTSEVK